MQRGHRFRVTGDALAQDDRGAVGPVEHDRTGHVVADGGDQAGQRDGAAQFQLDERRPPAARDERGAVPHREHRAVPAFRAGRVRFDRRDLGDDVGREDAAEHFREAAGLLDRPLGRGERCGGRVDQFGQIRVDDGGAFASFVADRVDEQLARQAGGRPQDDLVEHAAGDREHRQPEDVAFEVGEPDRDPGQRAGAVVHADPDAPGRRGGGLFAGMDQGGPDSIGLHDSTVPAGCCLPTARVFRSRQRSTPPRNPGETLSGAEAR